MRWLVAGLVVIALAGCASGAASLAAPSPPTGHPALVPTATPLALAPADQAALAAAVSGADQADGSLAQTRALRTAYQAGQVTLLQLAASMQAETQALQAPLLRLTVRSTPWPAAWGCPVDLAAVAVRLAISTVADAQTDATEDQAFQRDAAWTHAVAQAALTSAQHVERGQPSEALAPDVLAARQSVTQAMGDPIAALQPTPPCRSQGNPS